MFKKPFGSFGVCIVAVVALNACVNSKLLTKQGWEKYAEGDIAQAELKFRKAIEKDSTDGEAVLGLSHYKWHKQELSAALEYCERALSLGIQRAQQTRARLYFELAKAAESSGQNELAMDYCGKAIKDSVGFKQAKILRAEINYHLALEAEKRNDFEAALVYCNSALNDNPAYEAARRARGMLYLMHAGVEKDAGRYDSALSYLDKAGNDDPLLNGTVNFHKTEIYKYKLEVDNALRSASKAYAFPLYRNEARFDLVKLHAIRDSVDLAIKYLFEFYECAPHVYEHFAVLASHDPDFYALRENERFLRWKQKIRRIKVLIVKAEGLPDKDRTPMFTAADPYVTLMYDGRLILATPNLENESNPKWGQSYVIFDYKVGEPLSYEIYDYDPITVLGSSTRDEIIGSAVDTAFKVGSDHTLSISDKAKLVVQIVDSNGEVYTTNSDLPKSFFESLTASTKELVTSKAELLASLAMPEIRVPSLMQVVYQLSICGADAYLGLKLGVPYTIAKIILEGLENREELLKAAGEEAVSAWLAHQLNERLGNEVAGKVLTFSLCAFKALQK